MKAGAEQIIYVDAIIIDLSMSRRSELITVDLPDNDGKVTPYYTYDGYLEENDRTRISTESRSFEHLKVTGAAIFGFIGFIVPTTLSRPPAECPSPASLSKATPSVPLASSPASLEVLSAGNS